jgi:uncharacterized repeat protein (TIGR01451 family)
LPNCTGKREFNAMISLYSESLKAFLLLVCVLTAFFGRQVHAATAGQAIQNTANMTFSVNGVSSELSSNTVITQMKVLVDVQITAGSVSAGTIQNGISGYTYSYIVRNAGNGVNRFALRAAFANPSVPIAGLWIDINRNGLWDEGTDTRLDAVSPELLMTPGESVTVLVLSPQSGNMRLTATSLDDDPGAVVAHGEAQSIAAPYNPVNSGVTLIKSQTVDTRGAASPGTGTLITYSLIAHIPASAAASNIRLNDTVPAGTTYVAGSLSLDATFVSDGLAFNELNRSISVPLPGPVDTSHPSDHTVRFQVRIN